MTPGGFRAVVVALALGVAGCSAFADDCTAVWAFYYQPSPGAEFVDAGGREALGVSESGACAVLDAQVSSQPDPTTVPHSCSIVSPGVVHYVFTPAAGSGEDPSTQEYRHLPLGCTVPSGASDGSAASTVEAVDRSTAATKALHTALLACGGVLCFAVGVFSGRQR